MDVRKLISEIFIIVVWGIFVVYPDQVNPHQVSESFVYEIENVIKHLFNNCHCWIIKELNFIPQIQMISSPGESLQNIFGEKINKSKFWCYIYRIPLCTLTNSEFRMK